MSGFLTALNAIAQGAQGGFNVYALQQKQKQEADAQAQADADRQRQLDQLAATNQALHGVVDTGNAQQAEVPAKALNFGATALNGMSDAVKNLPFSQTGGAIPDPTMAPMLDQSATDIRKDAGPTAYNPNVNYSTVLDAQTTRRRLQDQEGDTASRNAATQAEKDWQHGLVQRQQDEANAEKARAAAAAPAARAYLQKQGIDPSQYPEDADALKAAQDYHKQQWDVNHREATPDLLKTNLDGTSVFVNPRTHAITGAVDENGQPLSLQGAAARTASSVEQTNKVIDAALTSIDKLIGPDGQGGLLEHGGSGVAQALPHFIGDRAPGAGQRADVASQLGFVRGATPALEARGRVSKPLLELMAGSMPAATDPPDIMRQRLQAVRQQMQQIRLPDPTPHSGHTVDPQVAASRTANAKAILADPNAPADKKALAQSWLSQQGGQ